MYVCCFVVEVLGRRTRNLTTIERDEDGLRSWLGIRLFAYNEGLFLSGSFFFLTGTKIVLRAVSGRSAVASRWLRCAEPSSLSWILLLKHRWSRIHILPFALFSFALKLIAYIYHLSFIYNLSVYISFHTPRPTKTITEKKASFVLWFVTTTSAAWHTNTNNCTTKTNNDRDPIPFLFFSAFFVLCLQFFNPFASYNTLLGNVLFSFSFTNIHTYFHSLKNNTHTHKSGGILLAHHSQICFLLLLIISAWREAFPWVESVLAHSHWDAWNRDTLHRAMTWRECPVE